jgi:hypothetical protein
MFPLAAKNKGPSMTEREKQLERALSEVIVADLAVRELRRKRGLKAAEDQGRRAVMEFNLAIERASELLSTAGVRVDAPRELLLKAAALLSERAPCAESECRVVDDGEVMKCIDELSAAARGVDSSCEWREEDPWGSEPGTYDSVCGERWSFIDGGPVENNVRFCQGCGKPVKLVPFPVPADEPDESGVKEVPRG